MSDRPIPIGRFSCGCVGFRVTDEQALLFKTCDGEERETLFFRLMEKEKSWEPISRDEFEKLVDALGALVNDGWRLRTIKSCLNVP